MKRRGERYAILLTEIEGVKLQVEPNIKEGLGRNVIQKFYRLAKSFFNLKLRLEKLSNSQEKIRSKIIELVESQEGLRGILSESDNFILTLVPREKISWNRELLKNSLGVIYSTVVSEELLINISIPIGKITKEGIEISAEAIIDKIKNSLISLGISPEDLNKMVYHEVKISVDEEKLQELIEQNRVILLPSAQEKEIFWVINTRRINQ